jgi:hypothetical protein
MNRQLLVESFFHDFFSFNRQQKEKEKRKMSLTDDKRKRKKNTHDGNQSSAIFDVDGRLENAPCAITGFQLARHCSEKRFPPSTPLRPPPEKTIYIHILRRIFSLINPRAVFLKNTIGYVHPPGFFDLAFVYWPL